MIRRQIALELGTVVPIIRLRDNIQLNPNQYIIKIKGIQVTEGEILFDHYMAMNPGYVEEEITGIPTFEPSFHLPAIWITESQRERAESLGYTVVDPPSIIATHLTEVIRSHIAELLTRQDVQNLVNNLKESNPVIVDELIPKLLGLGEIQKVLQNLLSEGISIRDLLTIFETLADHAQTTRDTDVLVFFVGPTGVGKTTTIAKIASKFKVNYNKNIAFITADTYRIAATDQLRTFANILDTPLSVIYTATELNSAVAEYEQADVIFVDTAGFSHKNETQRNDMRALLAGLLLLM